MKPESPDPKKTIRPRKYSLYIIELDEAVRKVKRFAEANSTSAPRKPCLYIGQTALSPEERFTNHLEGKKASRLVKEYGRRLRMDLLPDLAQAAGTREEAEAQEAKLAVTLRTAGFAIWIN